MQRQKVSIGEVTKWISGGTPNRSVAKYWKGEIPWISASTLKPSEIRISDQHLTPEAVALGSRMAPIGATLLLVRGSALYKEIRAGLVVSAVCFNQDIKALIPDPRIVPKFLTYSLLGRAADLLKLVSTAGNSAGVLDTKLVQAFEILLPSETEQRAITEALSDVDNLLESLGALIAKKRAIKQAAMQQLLSGKVRLVEVRKSSSSGVSARYKHTEVGTVPEEWEIASLRSCLCAALDYGVNAPAVPFDENLPTYLRISDISEDNRYQPSPRVSVNHPNSGSYILAAGDLVFARTGASVGNSYLYDSADGPLVFAGFLVRARPKSQILDSKYCAYVVQSERYWRWVTAMSSRSGQPGINGVEYGSFRLALPDICEQHAIAAVLSDIDSEILTLEQRRDKTLGIKNGMMQQLLTGRVRLV